MNKKLKHSSDALSGITSVLKRPWYLMLGIIVAAALLLFAIWLPNISLMVSTIISPDIAFILKARILWGSLGALDTNFTVLTRTFTIAIALLTGLNITMLTYYIRRRLKIEKSAGTSVLGMLIGLVGVGCASCGSVILSSFVGVGAATGFIGVLPLHGSEFGLLGVCLLIYANYKIALKINMPIVCSTGQAASKK
ncbi:hypothetical protein HQ524_02385 [Candidatus Uhrbacteria bacterium]|nr:hypothetical protein [Candidatus Uhrbacteria bacterium]